MNVETRMEQLLASLDQQECLSLLFEVVSKLTHTKGQINMLLDDWRTKRGAGLWDMYFVLSTFTKLFYPKRYLEIGTCRGVSASCVVAANPDIEIWTYDDWSGKPYGPTAPNLGQDFVASELKKVGHSGKIHFGGSSLEIPQQNFACKFSLILVDGDHTEEGATRDLNNVVGLVERGGIIVFDDITHKVLPHLMVVWNSFKARHADDFIFAENAYRVGCGIGMKK